MSIASPVSLASPTVTPPSPQHLQQIAGARERFKAIRRAAGVATLSGWTIAVFGALTLITSLFSFTGLLLGAGMCVIAHFELQGSKEIRRLNPDAPKKLARNQIVLGVALMIYAVISLVSALSGPTAIESAVGSDPELKRMIGSLGDIERMIYAGVYGGVILAAILGCGGAAWYYASRAKHIETYARSTPKWIIELQQAGMTIV